MRKYISAGVFPSISLLLKEHIKIFASISQVDQKLLIKRVLKWFRIDRFIRTHFLSKRPRGPWSMETLSVLEAAPFISASPGRAMMGRGRSRSGAKRCLKGILAATTALLDCSFQPSEHCTSRVLPIQPYLQGSPSPTVGALWAHLPAICRHVPFPHKTFAYATASAGNAFSPLDLGHV